MLDVAVWVTFALVLAVGGYLGFSMWRNARTEKASATASRAVSTLEQVVKQRPKDADARVKLAQALVTAGDEDGAIDQYRTALKLKKDHPGALTGLGLLAMLRKEWRTAEGYWEKLISALEGSQFETHDQRLEGAYYYMGVTKLERKDFEGALKYLKEAARIRKGASDTHYMLALAYKGVENETKYREELEIALAFDPNMAEANLDMGKLKLAEGDKATAAELFRRSADAAPRAEQPREALDALGDAEDYAAKARRLSGSDPAKALVEARIAGALDPQSVEAARLIAQLYEKAGNAEQALAFYQRVLSMSPNDAAAKAASSKLETDNAR